MGSVLGFWERLNRTAAEWIAGVFALLAVIALASLTSHADGLGAGLLFIGLVAGWFPAVVIHELGHALAAWLVGWRVWIISALPVCLRLGHRPRLTAELRRDVGGYMLASPSADAHDSRLRSILVTAGGPGASLAVGALLMAWLTALPHEPWEQSVDAGVLGSAAALSFYCFAAGVMSLWPMRLSDGHPNDGGKIVATLMERRRATQDRALSWAWGLFEYGVEPSAWPAWVRDAVRSECASSAPSAMAVYLGFAAAVETEDAGAARAIVADSAYDLAKTLRAYLSACVDDDPEAADAELASVRERLEWSGLLRFRAFALMRIHAAAGDRESAQRSFDGLAAAIVRAPAPEPFWELVLLRARRDRIAERAAPERLHKSEALPSDSGLCGPWGDRPR